MIATSPVLRHPCIFGLPALALALLFALPCPAADSGSPLVEPTSISSATLDQVNASARGLAGLAGSGPWESTSTWKDYQQWIDGRWSSLDKVRLSAMRGWGGSELGGLRGASHTVFYPFSGPDVLYADTFFPDSKYLVMAALEPVGTMPDLAKMQAQGDLGPYLQQVKTSLFTILAASFFKTKDMKNDFNNHLMDGLTPALVVFIARQGYHIDSFEYVVLAHDGTLHHHGDASGAPGIQITYGGGRMLLYFQTDLGNDGLHENPGFIHLMERLGPGITYLKAASYLLYEDYFSTIRDGILDNSVGVLEDDSGIPFHDFKSSEWVVTPYGNYTGPIGLFKEHYQDDLKEFYDHTPHSPLPFGSGYKFNASISSLLVAKKK